MIMRKRIEALVLVALLFIAATYLWGSPAVIVSKIPQQSSITYHDRKDNERIVPRNVTSLQHEQMVLSWKTAMHFMDWSISNHTTCLLCSRQRFLPPLPKDKEQLEQLWECPQQENSDKLSGTQQRKMPSTVIIGAQKGGTTTLSDALFSHPDIVMSARKELHFFSFTFHLLFRNGIPDRQVRIHYQNALTIDTAKRNKKKNATHFVDATPIYSFLSSRVPYWLLCTAPWVKTIMVIRNPVDRAYSEFNMHKQRGDFAKHRIKSFEEWIAMDMLQLKKAGVIRSFRSPEELEAFSGSTEELYAWDKYLSETSENAPIGRGLYALQLRHWRNAFEHFQKPSSDLLILQSEKMKTGRDKIYRQVLDHMGLEYHPYPGNDTHVRQYQRPMANNTRAKLMDFFKPYNQQLVKILGDEWDGVWDSN